MTCVSTIRPAKCIGYNPIHHTNYQYIDSRKGISETVEALYYNINS